jgi:hypothetical protein
MKQLAAGLSFLCFYFLLPTGAQSATLLSAHHADSSLSALSKTVFCFAIQSSSCSKCDLVGDGPSGVHSEPFAVPVVFKFAVPGTANPSCREGVVALGDRKYVLRTGLSPPLFT